MNRCPTPESVRQILETPEEDANFQALLAHVQQCVSCQTMWADFDETSSDDYSLTQPEATVSAVPPDVMRRLKQGQLARIDRSEEDAGGSVLPPDPASGSGRLEVRCPSCSAPMEVAMDTLLTDLTCEACGSHFSLVDEGGMEVCARPLSQLGRFELLVRVGFGSFGSVWRARDKELDRTVAIKIPRQAGMTSQDQEKFFREARAAAQLRHPNIVSVYEVGRDGENVFIVSDFVWGNTLDDWLEGHQLSGREAAALGAKIADALHHAHEQGIVHRDLKPANILIDTEGEPHLTDFGLARREAGEVTMTLEGQVLGTPAYMSPEQAQGNAHTADRRSDVYSLGVILFRLLTGELPFRGNVRMIMHQVIHDEPPSPRKLNGSVPKDLETITLKCLEKTPARRYQSAEEVVGELRRFLAGQPIVARPISWLERQWRWCLAHRAAAGLYAAIPLAVIVIAVVATVAALRIEQERRNTTDGLYRSLVREASALRQARMPGYRARSWELLQQAAVLNTPLVDIAELRQEAVWSMGDFVALQPITLEDFAARVTCVRMGEDSDRLFVGFDDGTVAVVSARTRELQTLGRMDSPIGALAFDEGESVVAAAARDGRVVRWTRDGKDDWQQVELAPHGNEAIALAIDKGHQSVWARRGEGLQLEVWRCGEAQPMQTLMLSEEAFCAAIDPGVEVVAVGGARGELSIWSIATGEQLNQVMPRVGGIHRIAFSSDSNILACAGGDGFACIDVLSGERLSHNKETGCKTIALSPNGRLCAVSDPQGHVRIWNVNSNAEFAQLALENPDASLEYSSGTTLDFSRNGRWFSMVGDGEVRVWDLWKTPEMMTIEVHDGGVPGVAFSPDGNFLASVGKDGRCVISNIETGESQFTVAGSAEVPLQSVNFHPSGRYLAIGGWGNGLQIWDIERREQVTAPLSDGEIWCTAFSDDGTRLAATGKGGVWLWDLAMNDVPGGAEPLPIVTEVARAETSVTFYGAFSPGTPDFFWPASFLMRFDRDLEQPTQVGSVRVAFEVMPLDFFPDGEQVLVITPEGELAIHDVNENRPARQLSVGPSDFRVTGMNMSRNGRWAVVRAKPVGLSLVDLEQMTAVVDLPGSPTNSSVWFWKFSPDATRLAVACADGRIYVWDLGQLSNQLSAIGLK